MKEEQHPWCYYVPGGSKILIIGTFPPTAKNWSYDFFYPNKANLFWQVMAEIAHHQLQYFSGQEAVEERKNILEKLKIGVTDMGLKIIRKEDNSADENLTATAYMDIRKILTEHPSIQKIMFTSSSGKTSAVRWFQNYMKETFDIAVKFPKTRRPIKSQLHFLNKNLELVILHSTSRRAANRMAFENLVQLYKDEIS